MLDDKDSAISTLRACLMSSKGGVSMYTLQNDFMSLVGYAIPYQKFGFPSLEQFLKNVPGFKVYYGPNGLVAEAVPIESSAHITNMINKQKSSAPKRTKPFAPSRKPFSSSSWRPPPSSNRHHPQRHPNLSVTLPSSGSTRKVTIGSRHVSPPTSPSYNNSNKSKFVPPRLQKAPLRSKSQNEEVTVKDSDPLRKLSRLSLKDVPSDQILQEYGYQPETVSTKKTITSPFAPSAAIAAGRAKTEAEAVKDLKKDLEKINSPIDALSLMTNDFENQAEAVMDLKRSYATYTQPLSLDIQEYAPAPKFGHGRGRMMDSRLVPPKSSKTVYEYCEKLKLYSIQKGWPEPIYKIIPRYPKNQRALYGCQVKIGDGRNYLSCPDESIIPEEAREFAAKNAYTELMKMENVDVSAYKITDNMSLMCDRISQIISSHPNGLWTFKVAEDYQKIYQEELPHEWLNYLSTSSLVSIDRIAEDKIIIFPNSLQSEMALPNSPILEPLYVGELTLPTDNQWSVYITCVTSTTEVWVRLIGEEYSSEYENLTAEMEMYYANNLNEFERVICPEVGAYYAVSFEDSWYRVCVQEIRDDKACCWLIDHGDYDEFPFEKMFNLNKKFYNLPRQAVQCQLAGLEDFGNEKVACNLITEMLIGNILVADIQSRDYSSGVVTVVLYDTSTDDDVNINKNLIDIIFTAMSQPLLQEGVVKEATICHVTMKGEVYLTIKEEIFNQLSKLLSGLDNALIEASKVLSVNNIHINKLYLVKYAPDQSWQRALVLQFHAQQHNMIEVFYVDLGITDTVTISDISNLGLISETLEKIPYQAIQVQLKDVPLTSMTPAKVRRLHELLVDKDSAVVKVITPADVPIVDLYTRLKPSNELISINDTIALDPELNKSQVTPPKSMKRPDMVKLMAEVGAGDCLPTRGLHPPVIQTTSEGYFDIYVTMVASPSNFTVRPVSYESQFKEMETIMQNSYSNDTITLRDDEIFEEEMYAAKDKNGKWCRCRVLRKLPSKVVTIHNSDYGDISLVPYIHLKPLLEEFKQLPYLALKAKLHGIVPSHSDWSVDDCLRVQDLLINKTLVSFIEEKGKDNANGLVLGLRIIDTTTIEDIDIAALLITEGRAISTLK